MARKSADDRAAEIIARLDVRAEYAALGVQGLGAAPSAAGWIECLAYGRNDTSPSAGINVQTGRYKDHSAGQQESNLSLWDFAARTGRFTDWKAAQRHYAEKAGVQVGGGGSTDPAKHLTWLPWDAGVVGLWCALWKPGVTPAALELMGARLARYRDQHVVVAVPIWPTIDRTGKPAGWSLWNVSGGELPVFHGKGQAPKWKKIKLTAGSGSGVMGHWPTNARRVWKVEGPADAAALLAILPSDRLATDAVLTNGSGCAEHPRVVQTRVWGAADVVVIGDRDEPGVAGAARWSEAFARAGCPTRNVALPYPVAEKHGQDLRDWINEGHTFDELTKLAEAIEPATAERLVIEHDDDPHRLARVFLNQRAVSPTMPGIRYWREEWHEWVGLSWRSVPESNLRAELTRAIKQEFDRINLAGQSETAEGEPPKANRVTQSLVTNVLGAMQGECILDGRVDAPFWIGDEDPPIPHPASELFTVSNGVLHIPTAAEEPEDVQYLFDPTPALFTPNSVYYPYSRDSAAPVNWIGVLRSQWPNDQASIDMLQEWFGYCIQPETRYQKMLMMVGPPRSGKGTIATVLEKIIGEANCVGVKLSTFGQQFGLWCMVGKTLAKVDDARLSHRSNTAEIIESLLSITGEGTQTIDRKNLPAYTTRLRTRIMVLTNEIPDLRDASGAFTSRCLMLRTTRSFLGSEDTHLADKLDAELPSILRWALRGWLRLKKNGRFTTSELSQEMSDEVNRVTRPAWVFLEERCLCGSHRTARASDIYAEWKTWCEEQGIKSVGNEGSLARQLRSVLPELRSVRERDVEAGKQVWWYKGVALKGVASFT